MAAPDCEVLIVGAGFSGVGAAIRLAEIGIHDFAVLERADDVGGTWRDHDYPGLVVDMPSFIYCYPFEMRPDWSRVYPPRDELLAYARHCADAYGVRPHIRFGAHARRAEYDGGRNLWRTTLASGQEITSRYFVNATGLLVEPRLPEIDGIDDFQGKLLHSARWDHGYEWAGKRVAVIGTGATGVQLIPELAGRVARLDVYQRTPIWLLPKPDAAVSEAWQRAFRRAPFVPHLARYLANLVVEVVMGLGFIHYRRFPWIFDWIERQAVSYIRAQVRDPALQEKLVPQYSFFCKRPSFSNDYYDTFNREHVELVTEAIAEVTPRGIVTADGREREVDALVCATGYSVFDESCMPNLDVIGLGGRNLGAFWAEHRYQAYEGASVPGFPNFFLVLGPYSAAGASYFTMIDTQTKHLVRCLREARRRGADYIEVTRAAHDRDFAKVQRRRESTVLFAGRCAGSNSYYFDAHGDTPALRPVTGMQHWLNSRLFPMRDYRFERRATA